jgi:putative membrane protein
MVYLWIKALHIIFVVTWFAGLFYLPRLFVYHAQTHEAAVRAQLQIMERRLLMITHIGGGLAIMFGFWTLAMNPGYLQQAWMHMKLPLVGGLIFYHGYLVRLKNRFAKGETPHSPRWLRIFNEVPALALIAIVLLAVIKPS